MQQSTRDHDETENFHIKDPQLSADLYRPIVRLLSENLQRAIQYTAVVHKLRRTDQIRPTTSRQVDRKVQQESLKYEKYNKSFSCAFLLLILQLRTSPISH